MYYVHRVFFLSVVMTTSRTTQHFTVPESRIYHLGSHAARTALVEREGVGVEQPVRRGVGEASNQFGAGGRARSTIIGRQGARDKGAVVVRGPFERPGVFAGYCWAVFFIAGKFGVHGVPDVVLPSYNT